MFDGMDPREKNVVTFTGGDPESLLDELAPGVRGYFFEDADGCLRIPLIKADRPGHGDVSRYLDALRTDRQVSVPAVVSVRLREMLDRRGFTPHMEWSFDHGEWCEVFSRGHCTLIG